MVWRRPLLEVRRASTGKDIMPQLKGRWISVKTVDKDGSESDTAEITCKYKKGFPLPAEGEAYDIYMGWADEGLVLQGRYTVQKPSRRGGVKKGHLLVIKLRAADYVDKLKAEGSQHYDPDMTFGDLMKDIAKQSGVEAAIDPDLAKVKLGYRLRWQQSPIDFAAQIAEEIGGVVKPAGGKLIATKRGGGKSASGRELDPIHIYYNRCSDYEIEIEPRPACGSIAAAWQDPKTGRRKMVKEKTGREGPTRILDHPYLSEAEAKEAAKAEAYEAGNASGTGSFEVPGLPKARGGAPVIVHDFGEGVDGKWKAESVEKTIDVNGGFSTSVSVTAGSEEKGKGKGKGKGKSSGGAAPNDSQLPH